LYVVALLRHFRKLSENVELMVKKLLPVLTLLIVLLPALLPAQRYFSRSGVVTFDASSPRSPEHVTAVNRNATLVVDAGTGKVEAAVLIKGFLFERALMQEHFNETYMESGKYPKANFKGKLDNPGVVRFDQDGTYAATITGQLALHGVTRGFSGPITITVKNGQVTASTSFTVTLADYGLSVPSVVADKLAEKAQVKLTATLAPMK
jgi:polyisoprenoid-binding protein YceI